MIVKRYNIYLANLDPTIGSEIRKTRPVVIISDDKMNKYLDTVVACPLTTKLHPTWRSRIQTVCEGRKAEIAVDQIRTLSKLRLIKRLDKLPAEDITLLRQLITEMYGE
ncbi:MAG TPA: type II toxin-antitoxin system PemK/MazF family toxin [Chloroflexi bacterium]|nr:type II toxin-antitoxin system PemK/MazF family toxin [Chloroflexota bacterium]